MDDADDLRSRRQHAVRDVLRIFMISLKLILLILALIVFALASIGVTTTRINLIAAGLALWVLATIVP